MVSGTPGSGLPTHELIVWSLLTRTKPLVKQHSFYLLMHFFLPSQQHLLNGTLWVSPLNGSWLEIPMGQGVHYSFGDR